MSSQNGAPETLARGITKAGEARGRIPPLVVAAQEGGIYRSFGDLPPAERPREADREHGDQVQGQQLGTQHRDTVAGIILG